MRFFFHFPFISLTENISKVWTKEVEIEDLTVVKDSVLNVQQSTSSSSSSSSRPTDQKHKCYIV